MVLHAHLSQAAVDAFLSGSPDGVVVRVEELGPMLLEQFVALTGRADLALKPVIDLNTGRSVNQYEHPADVKERGFLRTTGDVFPHAQAQSRRHDRDHPDPYDSTGPPGQTGDHNHAPLGRRNHRAKTHLGYQVIQIDLNRYLWRTPHGLWRLVDGSGTHRVERPTDAIRHSPSTRRRTKVLADGESTGKATVTDRPADDPVGHGEHPPVARPARPRRSASTCVRRSRTTSPRSSQRRSMRGVAVAGDRAGRVERPQAAYVAVGPGRGPVGVPGGQDLGGGHLGPWLGRPEAGR